MKNNNNTVNSQKANSQLNALLDEAKKIVQEIDETNGETAAQIGVLSKTIDESINSVGQIYSELDQIEKEAGDEIDALILNQAEALAGE